MDEQFDGAAAGSEWRALARGARERATVARQDMLEARCDGGSVEGGSCEGVAPLCTRAMKGRGGGAP